MLFKNLRALQRESRRRSVPKGAPYTDMQQAMPLPHSWEET